MSSYGWIKVDRQLHNHWLWNEKPFSKGQAWIDILLLANSDDKRMAFDGEVVDVHRGQFVTSIRRLSLRWGWDKSRVLRFLRSLEKDGMIERTADNSKTLLTLVNYGKFQGGRDSSETQTRTQTRHKRVHPCAENRDSERDSESLINTSVLEDERDSERDSGETLTETPMHQKARHKRATNKNIKNKEYITPYNPPAGDEWDYSQNSNLENVKHFLNTSQYKEKDYLRSHQELWDGIKTWMSYKDEQSQGTKEDWRKHHYKAELSIQKILTEICNHAKEDGARMVVEIINASIGRGYTGIIWDLKKDVVLPKERPKLKPKQKDRNEGLDRENPDDPNDRIIHNPDDGWAINDDGYWVNYSKGIG